MHRFTVFCFEFIGGYLSLHIFCLVGNEAVRTGLQVREGGEVNRGNNGEKDGD